MAFGPLGPNGEVNGTDVLLYVDNGLGTQVVVGSQRGLDVKEATAFVDMSSKASRLRRGVPGRYSADATLTHCYIPSSSGYGALKRAMRNGAFITVRRMEGGSALEDASAVVTSLGGNFPDQGAAIISVGLAIDGGFA